MPTPLELRTADSARKEEILQTLFSASSQSQLNTKITNKVNPKSLVDAFSLFNVGSIGARSFWHQAVKAVFTSNTVPTNVKVKSSTGYVRAIKWDGTIAAISTSATPGSPTAEITVNFGTLVSPYNIFLPKFFAILPTNSAGSFVAGNITHLSVSSIGLNALDVSSLTSLTFLHCNNNQLTSLDVSSLTALTNLDCQTNLITSLDVSSLTALTDLNCKNNLITSLDTSNLISLLRLYGENNKITSLNFLNSPNLITVQATNNLITEVQISRFISPNIGGLFLDNNKITTLDLNSVSNIESFPNNISFSLNGNFLSSDEVNRIILNRALISSPYMGYIGLAVQTPPAPLTDSSAITIRNALINLGWFISVDP